VLGAHPRIGVEGRVRIRSTKHAEGSIAVASESPPSSVPQRGHCLSEQLLDGTHPVPISYRIAELEAGL